MSILEYIMLGLLIIFGIDGLILIISIIANYGRKENPYELELEYKEFCEWCKAYKNK